MDWFTLPRIEPSTPPPVKVLLVCTGNICRSPMAEALFRDGLARRGVPAVVRSAGLVTEDRPASPHGVEVMADRGLDLSAHRSRRLTAPLVAPADLVVGMERQHVREVAVLAPDRFAVSFTLPELVRRATEVGPRPPERPLGEWLAGLTATRTAADLLRDDPDDEVADPYGTTLAEYRRTADQLERLVGSALDLLFP